MSRIGKKPVAIPSGIKVSVENGRMIAEKGNVKLSRHLPENVKIEVNEKEVKVISENEAAANSSAMQGLTRSLLAGMIEGLNKGFKKELEIVGVGYKAKISGKTLELSLGFSHPVIYNIPEGIKISVADNVKIAVEGADKELVGEVAANIRRFKKPEPYKGKGIRYVGEHITIKEGKTVGT